jgi:hypothetical protein
MFQEAVIGVGEKNQTGWQRFDISPVTGVRESEGKARGIW